MNNQESGEDMKEKMLWLLFKFVMENTRKAEGCENKLLTKQAKQKLETQILIKRCTGRWTKNLGQKKISWLKWF